MKHPIWRPSPRRVADSNMQRFLQAQAHRLEEPEYDALYRWSLDHNAEFWAAYWEFSGIRAMTHYRSVLTDPDRMPGARWFEGARLNYADNLLRPEHRGTALVFYSERGDRIEMSWDELRRDVAALARVLQSMGVERRGSSRRAAAQPAGGGGRDAGLLESWRCLVVLFPGLWRGRRTRPLQSDPAQDPVRDRRLFLQRQDYRLPAHAGSCRRTDRLP